MKNNQTARVMLAFSLLAGLGAIPLNLLAQGFGGNQGTAGRTGARSSSTASYPASTQMGTATVSVDPETRRVFVVTDEETADYVGRVIKDLDRPTPQVLIKCVFLEATYSEDSDIGVDGIYRHNVSGSSVDDFNGTGVATTPPISFGAGPTAASYAYSSLNGDLQVTLTALAKAGKTEILSRPSVLARNNQPATITVGQQVPLITNTRFDNFGNQINSVTYTDVGIILNVTPFITSDDLVEMVVSPEISALADRTQWVAISGGGTNNTDTVRAPVINTRSADTVVVVPDGNTAVIGGLMQNQKLTSENKVPILGDIPLLGLLFKHKVTSDVKTELLIFMTPHIVKAPGELASMTSSERSNTRIAPKAFTDEELNRYLNGLPNLQESK